MLAFGPWMVRLADRRRAGVRFWRLALAAPFLLLLAEPGFRKGGGTTGPLLAILGVGGLFFAADLGVWHISIGMTKLANATLFANMSSFLLMLYGFVIARRCRGGCKARAVALRWPARPC
jgi:drug/metabolite transporter (DMT)-like permease